MPSLIYALNIVGSWARLAAALISLVLASVLFLKRPNESMALFLSYFLLVHGIVVAGPLASLEFYWPGLSTLVWNVIAPILFAPLLIAFLSIFPNGRFVPHQTRWLVVVSLLYAPFSSLLFNANGFSGFAMLYIIGALLWFALIFTGFYAQIYRYRYASNPTQRQQTKWVLYGFTLAILFAFLITAREEERRRLRRDLHDGLGPILASQGLKMAAVSQLIDVDPDKARRLVEALVAQNEATVAEIRRLVYELRPAALDDLGLVGAVRDFATGLKGGAQASPRLKIDVQAPAGGFTTLPAAIEVAAYRIATEGLTNIARHAQARHAEVSFVLNAADHTRNLHLEIVDDGIGLSENQRAGVGVISMRERAEEVGGYLLIESSPGRGTHVVADLPLVDGQ